MLTLTPLFASTAIVAGFTALVTILVTARRPRATGRGEAPRSDPRGEPGQSRSRYVPAAYLAFLDRRLALAGRPPEWTMRRILLAKPLLAAGGAVLAGWWISADPVALRILLGAALVVMCFSVPDLLLISRGQERQEKIQVALADTLDQMTIAVEAGLGFEAAMKQAATAGRGPLADELVRTLQDMSIGRTRKDAYQALGERTSSEDLRRFTRAVVQADEYGIAVASVLRVQAAEMRLRRRQHAEEKAMKIPVKVLFPLIFCILPVLFIVLLTPAAVNLARTFL